MCDGEVQRKTRVIDQENKNTMSWIGVEVNEDLE
jgi:hypothetical protein